MKDKQFDRIIRDRLENLAPEYQPGRWELLEQQLEAGEVGVPEPDDQVMDELVFRKLHRLEKPYRENHWAMMTERLDREFVRPDEVLRYKALELALLVLLLFTLWQTLPVRLQPVAAQHSRAATAPGRTGESVVSEAPAAVAPPPASRVAPSAGKEEIVSQAPINGGEEKDTPASEIASFPAPLLPASVELKSAPATLPAPGNSLAAAPPARAGSLAGLSPLASRPAFPFTGATAVATTLTPDKGPGYLHFGMFGSLDYNRIITPPDRFLDVETRELDRYELGYSGGFSLGVELSPRWEIQTGLIYSSKNYQPSALIVQSGNFRDGYEIERLKDIELNIIHVPLNFRYNLIHYDKTRFYVLAGASLQVATLGNYYVEGESSRRSSVLARYIENGWFEGGSFRDNSYLTGNLGFGLEHFVTTRWSVFAQPTYQHALDFFRQGLGSTHDRISTMSIYSGIRIRLER